MQGEQQNEIQRESWIVGEFVECNREKTENTNEKHNTHSQSAIREEREKYTLKRAIWYFFAADTNDKRLHIT